MTSLPGSPTAAAAAHQIPAGRSTTAGAGSAAPVTNTGFRNGRRGKFNAAGEFVEDGKGGRLWCASEAEAERYRQLLELERDDVIRNLRTQVTFPLVVNNHPITRYRADFVYDVVRDHRTIVEDVKGMETPEFKLKHKLFNATQPVKLSVILVTGKARHPTRPRLSEKTGKPVASTAGWLDLHWKGRLPE